MAKSADAFRTISEVADWLETPAHVLRFWESKFSQVKPVKRAGGRRYYRPADMKLIGGIKKLLHQDGLTIKGVQKILREQGVKHVSALSQPLGDAADDDHPIVEAKVAPTDSADIVNFRHAEVTSEPIADPESPETEEEQDGPDEDTIPSAAEEPSAVEEEGETEGLTAASEATETSEPVLPSFMNLRGDQPEDIKPAEPEPPAPPTPNNISVPDDLADDVQATPGILLKLHNLQKPLSHDAAQMLSPVLQRLRTNRDGSNQS